MDPLIENLKATTHAICRYLWAQFAHFGLILITKLFHKHREQRFRPRPGLAGTAGGPQKQPEQRSAALGMVVFGAHGHSGPDYHRSQDRRVPPEMAPATLLPEPRPQLEVR